MDALRGAGDISRPALRRGARGGNAGTVDRGLSALKVFVCHGKTRRSVTLEKRIGGGLEGTVYSLPERLESAAKLYKRENAAQIAQVESRRAKIVSMLGSPPRVVSITVDNVKLPLLAWPTHLIEQQDKSFAGFLMPLVADTHAVSLERYMREISIPKTLSDKERCLTTRLTLCRSLAGVVADLHHQGHYVVDFKPQNVRVFRGSCIPCFLDNDSFSIAGANQQRFSASAFTPEYTSAEFTSTEAIVDDAQDRFALAVLIFQILNRSMHPFQGVLTSQPADGDRTVERNIARGYYAYGLTQNPDIAPMPGSDHDCLPHSMRLLFDRAFSAGAPGGRPSALEWSRYLEACLRSKPTVFKKCEQQLESEMHIHFDGYPCPECRRQAVTVVPAAAPGEPATVAPPVENAPPRRRRAMKVAVAIVLLLIIAWFLVMNA